jgi:hypothetical protein
MQLLIKEVASMADVASGDSGTVDAPQPAAGKSRETGLEAVDEQLIDRLAGPGPAPAIGRWGRVVGALTRRLMESALKRDATT